MIVDTMLLYRLVSLVAGLIYVVMLAQSAPTKNTSREWKWAIFKSKFNKKYLNKTHEKKRKMIFNVNMVKIAEHNLLHALGQTSFTMGINEFADMTSGEFIETMNRLSTKPSDRNKDKEVVVDVTAPTPHTLDWRELGCVTPVKHQGQCGSCYAFSSIAALEALHFRQTGQLVVLSEQNIVDCSQYWGNSGCNGGFITRAYQYVIDNDGVDTEASYPYKFKTKARKCQFTEAGVGATMTDYRTLPEADETALLQAVTIKGPIAVAISAIPESFQLYENGVYDEPDCTSEILDHAVVIVGFGTFEGRDYWIVKNSWGTSWGDAGYMYMSRNKNNQCGIATLASYPIGPED